MRIFKVHSKKIKFNVPLCRVERKAAPKNGDGISLYSKSTSTSPLIDLNLEEEIFSCELIIL